LIYYFVVGTWRRLVAHLNGVQGVGGSNPLVPTRIRQELQEVGDLRIVDLFAFRGDVYHFFTTR
jgi:hypothetical protein